MEAISLEPTGYQHPDVQLLVAQVQQVYLQRYGHEDVSPIDATEFELPRGMFFLATMDDRPAAMGGWRRLSDGPAIDGATAEVRRMYVSEQYRGRGLARAILARLESTAREQGCGQLILETGIVQPEAIGLYRSSGYRDIPAFGHYAGSPLSVCLGKQLRAVRLSS